MFTQKRIAHTRQLRRGPILTLSIATVAGILLSLGSATNHLPEVPEGRVPRVSDSDRPAIRVAFARESYRPGERARLFVSSAAGEVSLQVFHAGPERIVTRARDMMAGVPVTAPQTLARIHAGTVLRVDIGNWQSGLYFARLTGPGGRVGFAPFILRPRRLGEHRVAVVLPTQTWQAYNHRDDDSDGEADTWYVSGDQARLGRPHLNRGVPFRYKNYDRPFLNWAAKTEHRADYLSDADLHAIGDGRELARRYALIIFPGHHEYVTAREYDAITDYSNLGGNLIFLSANNFFYKIERYGNVMRRVAKWREMGRPEAALIGTQYFFNDNGERRGAWIVRTPIPWLFQGTGLGKGSRIANGGVEGDRVYPSSPRNVRVVAEIPNLFGSGMTAQMTYYERGGAKVFAAGAFTLAGAIGEPPVRRMVENLWRRLANDVDTGRQSRQRAANATV